MNGGSTDARLNKKIMEYSAQNILAIDCSTSEMKLGLQFGGDRLVKSTTAAEQSHSAQIIKGIAALLASANCKVTELDAIVVATGPGSFTGLRIGLACAKGMAVALNIPVVGVSLFEMAGYKLAKSGQDVKVVMRHRKSSYFVATVKDGKVDETKLESVTADDLAKHLNGSLVAGMGGVELGSLIPDKKRIIDSSKTSFDATELIYLGIQKLNRNEIEDVARLEPLYIEKSQAEIRFEQGRSRKN